MKENNMNDLVDYLSQFILNNEQFYSPMNTKQPFYLNIFLDEKNLGFGEFCDELARRLIVEKQIQELDSNAPNYNPNCSQQKKYTIFATTWCAWNILYTRFQASGEIKL